MGKINLHFPNKSKYILRILNNILSTSLFFACFPRYFVLEWAKIKLFEFCEGVDLIVLRRDVLKKILNKFIGLSLHTDVKQQLIPWQPNEDVKNTGFL